MISRFYQLSLITATLFLSFSPVSWGETNPRITNILAQTAIGDRKTEAQTLLQTGLKQLENNQAQAAIKSFQQALTIYQELKDRQGEGESLKNLGNAYAAAGNNTKAMEIYQQTLTIAREIKNRDLEARALQNIGTIYRLQENYTKAVEYLEPALLVAREIKSQELELKALVKATALRQAQVKFFQSNDSPDNLAQRGITAAQPVKSNLSHPYYWAPFVLIGNSL